MEGIITVDTITQYARENISPLLIYMTILLTGVYQAQQVSHCHFVVYVFLGEM